jgi:aspartyl-tRNA synthetase
VVGGLEALDTDDLSTIQTNQYDMVLNGYEILSGSIRNHDPEVLVKVFEKIGLTEDDVKAKFGAIYDAFQYGCPPHG